MRSNPRPLTARDVLDRDGVRAVFQPIVELESGTVIGYESLARGPLGTPLESPAALFASARTLGLVRELDAACRATAFREAISSGRLAPLTLFVNVEPQVLDSSALDELLAIARTAPAPLRVVFEVTERCVAARPAELLQTVDRIRDVGWQIALDDVGADTDSLAFMPLLRPEIVKLDLRLVQQRPDSESAEIMHAVGAYAEESGARVLAEGIENTSQLALARGLGAELGQGWLFGRPSEQLSPLPAADGRLPRFAAWPSGLVSPFSTLPDTTPLRVAPKDLLIALSKRLEREALAHPDGTIVVAAFQHARFFTAATARRYAALAAETNFVCALGAELPQEVIAGVRGADLAPGDPLLGEWDVAVITPHFSAALLARDLGDTGPDRDRRFEYALTYRRDTVVRAASAMLARVLPLDVAESRRLAA
jgi:EAL domain-containing protein (putative c-di-GMP-specific phosphodiesterase class I)